MTTTTVMLMLLLMMMLVPFQVIWTKRSSSFFEPKSSNRRSVPATQHTFQLHNLEQGASYLVQVCFHFIKLQNRLFSFPSVYPSVRLSVCLSVCPSVCPSVLQSVVLLIGIPQKFVSLCLGAGQCQLEIMQDSFLSRE